MAVALTQEPATYFASAPADASIGLQAASREELNNLLPGDPQFFGSPARGRGAQNQRMASLPAFRTDQSSNLAFKHISINFAGPYTVHIQVLDPKNTDKNQER